MSELKSFCAVNFNAVALCVMHIRDSCIAKVKEMQKLGHQMMGKDAFKPPCFSLNTLRCLSLIGVRDHFRKEI